MGKKSKQVSSNLFLSMAICHFRLVVLITVMFLLTLVLISGFNEGNRQTGKENLIRDRLDLKGSRTC